MKNRIRKMFRGLAADERGLTTVEYAIVLCLIAVVAVAAFKTFGENIETYIGHADTQLKVLKP